MSSQNYQAKTDYSSGGGFQSDGLFKHIREGNMVINKSSLRESQKIGIGFGNEKENGGVESFRGEDSFGFKRHELKSNKRPSSAFVSEPRFKTSPSGADTPQRDGGSAFLTNLNKLKDFNNRGLSATREQTWTEKEVRPATSYTSHQDQGGFFAKKALGEGKFGSIGNGSNEKVGVLIQNGHSGKQLEQKRSELRGRLNELLDKLAVGGPGGSVRGETRSVAPILAGREGDDNLSLNSFHSTAPPMTSLLSKNNGFTSFYK